MTSAGASTGYSALKQAAAWLDLSSRGKIVLTGEDRARLLHAMTTNHVQQLNPGEGNYVFFLNAQGRILGDGDLFCFEDHFLLDTEPETRTKLYEHLDRYIIADDVTLADQTSEMATIAVEGPAAASILEGLGVELPETPYSWTSWAPGCVARVSVTGPDGFRLFIPAEGKNALIAQLTDAGIPEATPEDARTVRIENGRPRYGEEITERYLVQETGQLQAVHFNKGCYLGQEIVERVRSRAQIHRVLRTVEIETTDVPAARAKLKSGEADAGEIASAVFSRQLGKIVALAYVRTPFAEPGTPLTLDGAVARVSVGQAILSPVVR